MKTEKSKPLNKIEKDLRLKPFNTHTDYHFTSGFISHQLRIRKFVFPFPPKATTAYLKFF